MKASVTLFLHNGVMVVGLLKYKNIKYEKFRLG